MTVCLKAPYVKWRIHNQQILSFDCSVLIKKKNNMNNMAAKKAIQLLFCLFFINKLGLDKLGITGFLKKYISAPPCELWNILIS